MAGLFLVQLEELLLAIRGLPDRGRVVLLAPPLRPWPSSGDASTWPGPQRSTAARVATTSAVTAAASSRASRQGSALKGHHKERARLGRTPVVGCDCCCDCCCVVVVVVLLCVGVGCFRHDHHAASLCQPTGA